MKKHYAVYVIKISTIQTLWKSDNLFVALPLIIFSVVIPILKILLMGIALIAGSDKGLK
jgi:uncharacterized paraquat-inducible protein A